jgi:large subunit ribosomal protein L29
MKLKEMHDKPTEQLQHEVAHQLRHLFDLRSQAVTEKLEDPTQLGKTRKSIARLKTIIRQRQLKEQAEKAAQ